MCDGKRWTEMKVKQLIVNCTPCNNFSWWTVFFFILFTIFALFQAISIKIVWEESKWCAAKIVRLSLRPTCWFNKKLNKREEERKHKRNLFVECKMKGEKCSWAAHFNDVSGVFFLQFSRHTKLHARDFPSQSFDEKFFFN